MDTVNLPLSTTNWPRSVQTLPRSLVKPRLAAAAERDGVTVDLEIAPDMYHVWTALLPNHEETLRAIARSAGFISALASGAGGRRSDPGHELETAR